MFKFQNTKLILALLLGSVMLLVSVLALAPRASVQAAPSGYYSRHFADHEDGHRKQALARDCPDEAHKGEKTLTAENCKIVKYLITFIDVLSAVIGIVVVIMIVVGGIQYSASRDNPQATVAAKERIIQALLALVFFLFTFAFLQWVVPGGVF